MPEPVAALLRVEDDLLARHPALYGSDPAGRSLALAEALATSPAWTRIRERARIAVRPRSGLIGVFGSVEPSERPLLDALEWEVNDLLARLLPVSYRDAEHAAFELAERLRAVLSPSELAACHLVPLPRGGFLVAGLLAYALGLDPDRLRVGPDSTGLTILVDDCAISGTRIRTWLGDHEAAGDVVVALLHAHPDLARRTAEDEPRVRDCVAARDLTDHAPARPDHAAWKERWADRSPTDYWIGHPDHVVYPWNEPDVRLWNPATSRAEAAWRVAPPAWCAKNRVDARPGDVQRCEAASGPIEPSPDTIWATFETEVVLARPGLESAVALRGSAAAMWLAIVSDGDRTRAATTVSSRYAAPLSTITADLDRFVNELTERGFVTHDA
jgi:hypothetical protein